MDEILDVRARLGRPLVRFRKALADATAQMESTDFGPDFHRDMQSLYRREIDPWLLELDEALDDLGAKASLRRAGGAVAASLGIAAAGLLSFAELIAAAIVPVGAAGGAELKHREEVKTTRRDNGYLFVWEADRTLTLAARKRASI